MVGRMASDLTLSGVVGVNARKLRGSATADELATTCRNNGLNWGTGRISDLEHGRVSPTLGTLVMLAAALGELRGEPVTLAELVEHDGDIELAKGLALSGAQLQRYLRGEPVEVTMADIAASLQKALDEYPDKLAGLPPALRRVTLRDEYKVHKESGETEQRVAKSLGVDRWVVDRASALLWKSTISAERDRRAGPDASNQARGRITRELRDELRKVIDGDN
jgi:transcriptional regulator with XRE-family HTH domain